MTNADASEIGIHIKEEKNMTGAECYREAERHLANAARHLTEDPRDMRIAEVSAAIGNGYAMLAAAAGAAGLLTDKYVGDGPHINDWNYAMRGTP